MSFQVFISFAASKLLSADHAKYFVFHDCCVAEEVGLFIVEVRVVVHSRTFCGDVVHWIASERSTYHLRTHRRRTYR